jgi:hypothetical protein
MQLFSRFYEPNFWRNLDEILDYEYESIDELVERYDSQKRPDEASKFKSIASYFYGIGALVKKRLIDIDLVYELMPRMIFRFWEKLKPLEQQMDPKEAEMLSNLYNELKKKELKTK